MFVAQKISSKAAWKLRKHIIVYVQVVVLSLFIFSFALAEYTIPDLIKRTEGAVVTVLDYNESGQRVVRCLRAH